jgi:dienelactone hydrolase
MIKYLTTTPALMVTSFLATCFMLPTASAQEDSLTDSLTPYTMASEVPQTALELWKDYDPRKEDLEVTIHQEWKENGVVSRLITFKVGTFKGNDSRIAAYYCFPDNGKKNPAFVWSHGGAQSASRSRGHYYATQGFATVDINWLGRPLEKDLDPDNKWGTHWGKIDPTHAGGFYPHALRDTFKYSLTPDAHSVDPILSPRNSNWFMLSLTGRRALTFLEQQPEVNAEQLGFAGFSMGATITSMTAIDKRLKAVAPFVGGTTNRYRNFDGMDSGADTHEVGDLKLLKNTIDPGAYWQHVTLPVMFISSSNDQYGTLDRIYQSMDLLPHDRWLVSCNMHAQHKPRAEQWVMLNQWFKQHLAGVEQNIPPSPPSTFKIEDNTAHFSVTPTQQERLADVEIYYSYTTNQITRFWKKAEAVREADSWKAELPVHPKLPLYTFALCRYRLPSEQRLERGSTKTFTLNSYQHRHIPGDIDLTTLAELPKSGLIDNFSDGMAQWGRGKSGVQTFKFQDSELDTSADNQLAITLDLKPGQDLVIDLKADSKYSSPEKDIGTFHYTQKVHGNGPHTILLEAVDFTRGKAKKKKQANVETGNPLEWSKISTFAITLTNEKTQRKINLTNPGVSRPLKRIELVKPKSCQAARAQTGKNNSQAKRPSQR